MLVEQLKARVEAYWAQLKAHDPYHRAIFAGVATPEMVTSFLVNIHYLVQHTPVHLQLAMQVSARLNAPKLQQFFKQKFHEEQGHDRWAEDDLRQINPNTKPAAQNHSIHTSMRDLIRHIESMITRDPHLYLSYIFFAEYLCVVAGPELTEALEKKCGFPSGSMSVVENHAELDKGHVHEWLQIMSKIVDENRYGPQFIATLEDTIRIHEKFCNSCAEQSSHAAA